MSNPLLDAIREQIVGTAPASPAPTLSSASRSAVATFLPANPSPEPRLVALRNFLRTVLPDNGPIYFAVTLLAIGASEGRARHYACRSIDELADRLLRLDAAGDEAYFATASYQQARFVDAAGRSRQRCGENVAAVRACWLDIDVGPEKSATSDGYETQREARQVLSHFSSKLGVEPSLTISSGRGLHVYFCFKQAVSPAEWKAAAKALKHACTLGGLRADATRTEDIASILRPVGCMHRKNPADPQRVVPLSAREPIAFADFLGAVEALTSAVRNAKSDSTVIMNRRISNQAPTVATAPTPDINADLSAGVYEPVHWLRNLAPDEQLRVLDAACSAIPSAEWSRYDSWRIIIAGIRGLHDLGEEDRLALLERHSARSPKWTADGWNQARLAEKFRSFTGGSARHVFELAEAYGWRRATASLAVQPFGDLTAAEDYFVGRFIYVTDQAAYLDLKGRQMISVAALDESQLWLLMQLAVTPRRLLKASARTRRADSLGYHPGASPIYEETGKALANLYVPWSPPPAQPTIEELDIWNWFIEDHLFRRAEDKEARDYFLNALAYPLQAPGRRVASVPLLIGEKYGSGKSTLMERVPRLVYGERNVTVAAQSEIESGFNDWHANAQIICFPEIWMGGGNAMKLANELKDKITNEILRVYPKGLKGYSQPNRATLLGTSNYENAVHLREGDRRWGVHITDAPKMSAEEARALYAFLNSDRAAGVLRQIFLQRDLSGFNAAGEPPMTAGKLRVIEASRSPIEAEIADLFDNQDPPFDREVFVLEWLRAALHGRVPGLEKIAWKRLAQYVQAAPISAVRLPGRKRLKVSRMLSGPLVSARLELDGKHGVWCRQNADTWKAASDKEIAQHLETGAPPLASFFPARTPAPMLANPESSAAVEDAENIMSG